MIIFPTHITKDHPKNIFRNYPSILWMMRMKWLQLQIEMSLTIIAILGVDHIISYHRRCAPHRQDAKIKLLIMISRIEHWKVLIKNLHVSNITHQAFRIQPVNLLRIMDNTRRARPMVVGKAKRRKTNNLHNCNMISMKASNFHINWFGVNSISELNTTTGTFRPC